MVKLYLLCSIFIVCLYTTPVFSETDAGTEKPIVKVKQGQLKGSVLTDIQGNKFYSFQGVPYAEPPVGDLRFKAPQPLKPWEGVKCACKEGNVCISFDMFTQKPIGSEDCLYLNVFTKELPGKTKLKPVMVWIHGGGFTTGSSNSDLYGPQYLVTEDIVLVTLNYRLGILGFLSLEDPTLNVPGNAGLKDMVMALKWVQQNIEKFNGDPNNVTIFGESAGSAACHYLILSESAKGLFHRAILQSGSALNQWAKGQKNAVNVAQAMGNKAQNEKEALEYLKSLTTDNFWKIILTVPDILLINETRPFSPTIEYPHEDAFITEEPIDIMTSGKYNKVPVIMGYTSQEGMFLAFYKAMFNMSLEYRPSDFENEIPFYFNLTKGSDVSKAIAKKIEDFYYGPSTSPSEEDADKYFTYNSDAFFVRGIQATALTISKTSEQPIYLYKFSFESSMAVFKKLANVTRPGVCHGEELFYLFKTNFTPEINLNSIEGVAMQRMVKLWTNFAKFGNPTPGVLDIQWKPITKDEITFLNIDKELTIVHNPEKERMVFWDAISSMAEINSNL